VMAKEAGTRGRWHCMQHCIPDSSHCACGVINTFSGSAAILAQDWRVAGVAATDCIGGMPKSKDLCKA